MKKLLLLTFSLSVVAVVGLLFSSPDAAYTYKPGNVAAIQGDFQTFYHDTLIVKAGKVRTIYFPEQVWNFKCWINDPYVREESLKVAVGFNAIKPNPTTGRAAVPTGFGIIDFGYNNGPDTIYFYGGISSVTYTPTTNTAGADANDSLACIEYWASSKR